MTVYDAAVRPAERAQFRVECMQRADGVQQGQVSAQQEQRRHVVTLRHVTRHDLHREPIAELVGETPAQTHVGSVRLQQEVQEVLKYTRRTETRWLDSVDASRNERNSSERDWVDAHPTRQIQLYPDWNSCGHGGHFVTHHVIFRSMRAFRPVS